jgi:hypothetical protein
MSNINSQRLRPGEAQPGNITPDGVCESHAVGCHMPQDDAIRSELRRELTRYLPEPHTWEWHITPAEHSRTSTSNQGCGAEMQPNPTKALVATAVLDGQANLAALIKPATKAGPQASQTVTK